MKAAGFKDYAAFIRAVYSEVQKHADAKAGLPVYYNLGDEPIGDDLLRAAENAEAYRRAFPKGPPYFTGGQQLHRQRPARTRTSGWPRPCTWSTGTATTRRR